jgi:hypothetical protein
MRRDAIRLAWMAGALVCVLAIGAAAHAQAAAKGQGQGIAPGPEIAGGPGAGGISPEWVPQGVETLGDAASDRIRFRLEHGLLALATNLAGKDRELGRVVNGVDGVTVRSFGFPAGVEPTPGVIEEIRQEYREAGWTQLVNKQNDERAETTGLWLRMDRMVVRDIAVLLVRPRRVDFIAVSGTISPIDLLHLSGHFGIPKMNQDMGVPLPDKP